MVVLNKTNTDWWKVRKSNGVIGYMPANYVEEVEPKFVNVEKKKPVTVVEEMCRRGKGLSSDDNAQPELCSVGSQERENLFCWKLVLLDTEEEHEVVDGGRTATKEENLLPRNTGGILFSIARYNERRPDLAVETKQGDLARTESLRRVSEHQRETPRRKKEEQGGHITERVEHLCSNVPDHQKTQSLGRQRKGIQFHSLQKTVSYIILS